MTEFSWRTKHTLTDWEFEEIGKLLCDHEPRDLARMVVRLEGQIEVRDMMDATHNYQALRAENAKLRLVIEKCLGWKCAT